MHSEASIGRLKRFCKQGQLYKTLDCANTLCDTDSCHSFSVYSRLLQGCLRHGDLAGAAAIHSVIFRSGLDSDAVLGTYLVRLYASSGRLPEASQVFERIQEPNVFSWSAIIAAHTKLGHDERALELYIRMRQSRLDADGHLYVAVVKASAASGLVQHGYEKEALDCCGQMLAYGLLATKVTFVCILKACSNLVSLDAGIIFHVYVIEAGYELDCGVSNTLIDLYLRCGSSLDALTLFKQRANQNIVTWNIIISGLVQQGHVVQALGTWVDLLKEGWKPDRTTFGCSLQACVSLSALHEGKLIHILMLEVGFNLDTSVSNTLLDMYCTCGALDDGCSVFFGLPNQDVVAWNVIIKGMVQQGCHETALQLFQQMQLEGVLATGFSFVFILNAIASLAALMHGKVLHACVLANGLCHDAQVSNAFMNMYLKCESFCEAYKVFDRCSKNDDISAWNTMLSAYADKAKGQESLDLFVNLHQAGSEPDRITFICMLKDT